MIFLRQRYGLIGNEKKDVDKYSCLNISSMIWISYMIASFMGCDHLTSTRQHQLRPLSFENEENSPNNNLAIWRSLLFRQSKKWLSRGENTEWSTKLRFHEHPSLKNLKKRDSKKGTKMKSQKYVRMNKIFVRLLIWDFLLKIYHGNVFPF